MTSVTTHTVVGFFGSRQQAETAINSLISHGFSRDTISVVATEETSTAAPKVGPVPETGSTSDTAEKAVIGGMAGFIVGIAALAIPGVGPVIAAGPLAAALTGAAAGAATGGLIGIMTDDGIPQREAERYSKAIRAGHVMVTLRTPEDRAASAADLLEQNGATGIDDAGQAVKTPKLDADSSLVARQRDRERRVSIHPGITGGGATPNA